VPGPLFSDPRESRALQYFVERTAIQFATFFADDLWNKQLLQLAHSESCIRHALVALSVYHEGYADPHAVIDPIFARHQHSLAIKEVLCFNRLQPMHIHFISCLIFICTEVLVTLTMSKVRQG
jgi:hypothetical protein